MKKIVNMATLGAVAAAASLLIIPGTASAEQYPDRPIEIIVTFGPGGGADSMGRTMSRLLSKQLGVQLPVSNVAGASGNAGLTKLATGQSDGYSMATLIALSVSSWASGLGNVRPDDLKVLAVAQDSPSMLFVSDRSPIKDFQGFLDKAKAAPGDLKIATSGYGTQDDVTLKYLAAQGYKTTNVPLSNPSERYASPLGGHTDAIYEEPGDVAPLLVSKKLRPIVVFSDERHPSFPDVPTTKEFGMQISDLPNFRTLAVKADTPPERIDRLVKAIDVALDSEEWKTFCTKTYTCTKKYTPEESQAHVADFYARLQEYAKKYK